MSDVDHEAPLAGALPVTPAAARSFVATSEETGQRLDKFLASKIETISRSRLKTLIEQGCVSENDVTIMDVSHRVKPASRYQVDEPTPEDPIPRAQAIALDIVFEDAWLLVVDKPAGLVVHPGAGNHEGTLVNALIGHCGDSLSGIGGVRRPGIVHRLDKDTSGLMVVAKNDMAHKALSAQFAAHGRDGRLERGYQALVWGVPAPAAGRIDAPLGRHAVYRTKMAVIRGQTGRAAATRYEVAETYPAQPTLKSRGARAMIHTHELPRPIASRVRCTLETGRTHQVRVHMAHIRHPLLGDQTYGAGFSTSARKLWPEAEAALMRLSRQALHAEHLAFEHPKTGKKLAFWSELPTDLQELAAALALGPTDH